MEREILFRGKRVDSGEWIEGSLVMVCNGETLKRYPCIVVSYNHDTFDWNEVKPDTIGQFTGTEDRNGVKIFEGDVIKAFRTTLKKDAESDFVAGVRFMDGCFFVNVDTISYMGVALLPHVRNCEVIGSIHDNPDKK
jgi:uncharacterized phage protein (TIGR01671 family)